MERRAWRPHGLLTQGTIFTGDASSIREANTNTQIKSIEDTAPLIATSAVSGATCDIPSLNSKTNANAFAVQITHTVAMPARRPGTSKNPH